MKCIIIDDEPLALKVIKSYCQDSGELEVLGTYTNVMDALKTLHTTQVDIIFCDIEMPQVNGIEFIESLDNKPLFVFTTAYPQYALEGFNLNAVDYLVKPIPFPRFLKAVNRARELYQLKRKAEKPVSTLSIPTEPSPSNFIFVKSEYENVKIFLEELIFIQGLKDYLKIFTTQEKPILTLMSFQQILDQLSDAKFVRVHKSYVVNIDHIKSIQKSRIFTENERIPIGDSYKAQVFKKLGI
ncbi:MAG: response regulator transcription factor [Bacteroidota bacterium]